jgi:hypothetical protein
VNGGKHLPKLRNSVYHSAGLESFKSESKHFRTYVDYEVFLLSIYEKLIPEVMPCVCVCVCVCVYIYIYIYIYIWLIYMYIHTYVSNIYVYTHVCVGITELLDTVHHQTFYRTKRSGNCICLRPQVKEFEALTIC